MVVGMSQENPEFVNSLADIRAFFERDEPLAPNEFVDFWQSLTAEEKEEFKKANLTVKE